MDDQHEEVEHIPWGELLAPPDDGRRRFLYLVAGALAALVLGVIVARMFASPSTAPADTGAAAAPVTAASAAGAPPSTLPAGTVAPAAPTTTTTTVAPPVLYSEADLMAFPPDLARRAAIARAEWFVTDYFTADLEPNGTADIRGALPAGVVLPVMPQDSGAGLSYVEWARAFRVEERADGTFVVGVAYRLLGAPPEQGFQRLAVRAVEVRVAVSEAGGSVVLDLPAPVVVPAGPTAEGWPSESEEPPQVVVDGALGAAAGWGSEQRLVGAARVPGGWRVLLTAADEAGNRWPLVVMVGDDGDAGQG
ncbi:MAG: hypothetical protein KQH83_12140 [Actinobacteria bacterium]|nr:hypothetical protein [Actinomycetota bacterium]